MNAFDNQLVAQGLVISKARKLPSIAAAAGESPPVRIHGRGRFEDVG